MAKGRKRKNGDRYPSGKLKKARDAVIGATPEQQSRRAWMAQGGDMAKTSCPLDVLLVNGQIDDREALIGQRLAWWHYALFGRPNVSAGRYEERLDREERDAAEHDDPNSEASRALQAIRDRYDRALAALDAISRHTRDDVLNVVVYERWPRFLMPVIPALSDLREARRVKAGLEALAAEFGGRTRMQNAA